MSPRPRISARLRRRLASEANNACSYCRSPAVAGVPMAIDHIIPLAAGGETTERNLCLACYRCNEFKGARVDAIDPVTDQRAPLYHPKAQTWHEHFAWSADGLYLFGLSPVGRATVQVLRLNDEWLVGARQIWILAGIHPPLA